MSDPYLGRLYLLEDWIDRLFTRVRSSSRVWWYKPTLLFLNLLGFMAATLPSVAYIHLHMHPIQWYLKHH